MEISDAQIADIQRKLRENDPTALDAIWDQYGEPLYHFLVSRLCTRTETDDVMQELFIRIAQKRKAVAGARNLSGYLFTLARNEAVNHIRKNRRRNEVPLPEFGLEAPTGAAPVDTSKLEPALASLKEAQREVVILHFFQGMTFKQIGEAIGVSQNTAASRYRYGMETLRKLLHAGETA